MKDRDPLRVSRRDLIKTGAKGAGLRLLEDTAKTTIGLGVTASVVAVVGGIDSAINSIHHNAAVRNAEDVIKLREQFVSFPQTPLSYIGEIAGPDDVQALAVDAFFSSSNPSPTEDKYKKAIYVITNEEYTEITESTDDGKIERFVFADFGDKNVDYFENYGHEYKVERASDVFKNVSLTDPLVNKLVVSLIITVGYYGDTRDALDSLASGGFKIFSAEGSEGRFGDPLGIEKIQNGTQRVYTVPPFTP